MTKTNGNINVQTENIFPVIKKFLYSDHEIFLRELVSNAIDATQKLRTLSARGEFQGELGDLTVEVILDSKKKTLTVSDRGIGMTADEVEKYINQIAFSGASDFLAKYKDVQENLIGHFGLGFYSAFMVADKVEIRTQSYKDAPAMHWTCDGSPAFTMEECKKKERGTDIILHIADDCKEFLEEQQILQLLRKYCRFMPVPIRFGDESVWVDSDTEFEEVDDGNGGKTKKPKRVEKKQPRIVNNTEPAWKKTPASLTDDDYKKFYHELYPMNFEEPLFQIHLNVDYPFNLTGILYFPKVRKTIDPNRNKIQLYCNQVFVTDSVEGVVPEYLMLLHGVLDSPDIPLNVSRSYLQSDSNVKKISTHISKKVADKLEEMFKSDREDFEKKWDDIKIFVEYGMLTDEKFCERAMKFYLLKGSDGSFSPLDAYREKIAPLQTDKDKIVCYLYANDLDEQHAYVAKAKAKGYDVLLMDSVLTPHFINLLEQKLDKSRFVRVDSDVVEKLIPHEDNIPEKMSKEDQEKLKPIIEGEVDKQRFTVIMESLESDDQPMLITQSEFMRRYREMAQTSGGGMSFYGEMPESYNLVVNVNHPLVAAVLAEADAGKQKRLVHQLTDLALLSNGLLKGESLTQFVQRSLDMIN
ncbi:MAG: molecular chaperone HtpG [bacterium P3]|nr:MAG: molecular chaperone HtpG [bacterium P3]KWW42331.1 MAG: molecular chaperone HtpG [bacterium F083]